MFQNLILTFIPLFVAFDTIGLVPIFISLTEGMEQRDKKRILRHSVITATAITLVFLIIGKGIFLILGITIPDFQIAGGLILLVIAITDIVQTAKGYTTFHISPTVGIVPIGTPIIAGPAVLTTLIMLNDIYGFSVTILSLLFNLTIIYLIFSWADSVHKFLGEGGARAVSKVVSLLLAAIAVMMIRIGLKGVLG
ncbi:MAG: MarC family protein [Deltaproteobacteria bacterium]|nr:MarC family protein [Deltaproteobacteria bacterium]